MTNIYRYLFMLFMFQERNLVDPLKLKSNGWSQQAEILATAVKSSEVFYEVPIAYSGRTFEEGKRLRQDTLLQ